MSTATLPPPPALSTARFESPAPHSEPRSSISSPCASAPASPRSPNSELRSPSAAAPAALRLSFWSTDHEVRPSRRTWERLDQVPLPTRHDTLGFRFLATQPDAAALLAAWTLLVQISARLPRPLRGLLVTDTGYAYTAADLALMTGFSADFFTRAFAFFQQPDVAWLAPTSADAIPAALEEIKLYRAAERARQDERYAQAAARRRERQAGRPRRATTRSQPPSATSPEASPPAAPASHPDADSATPELRSSNPDLRPAAPHPAGSFSGPAAPLAEAFAKADAPPADWNAFLLAVLEPETAEARAEIEQLVWSELAPEFQASILRLYTDTQFP